MKATLVCSLLLLLAVQSFAQDACNIHPTCAECISNTPCGWCAINITYNDGSQGPHCAGKPDNPPPGWKPWTCLKDYQNQACYGYICDNNFQCVSSGRPGGGVPLNDCLKMCFPPTYECNQTTYQCDQTTPGHGTDKPSCEAQCHAPQPQPPQPTPTTTGNPSPQPSKYECNSTTYQCQPATDGGGVPLDECTLLCSRNVTPIFVIGNWRGLQVNMGYFKGEWRMKVDENSTVILDPSGATNASGTIVSKGNELWLQTETPIAGIRRGIFSLNEVPEVNVLTWALGGYGEKPPANFDDGLQYGTAWVFIKCISDDHCNFKTFGKLAKMALSSLSKQKTLEKILPQKRQAINDPCMHYPDCHSCISAPESCGWCSVPVIYNNTVVGLNCAGTNTSLSGRINCTGTFSTVDCTFSTSSSGSTTDTTGSTGTSGSSGSTGSTTGPSNNWNCNPATLQCEEGGSQPKDVCDAQCVPNPIPPPLKNKYFRGLEIDTSYAAGEWRLFFSTTDFVLVTPTGQNLTGTVVQVEKYIVLKLNDGTRIASLWQTQPGPATTFLSWAWGKPNGDAPANFDEAMTTQGESEFFFISCLDGKPTTVCDFSQ